MPFTSRDFYLRIPCNITGKLNFLLFISGLLAAGAIAQRVDSAPAPRLLEARARKMGFARPRRVTVPLEVHAFSLQEATTIERVAFELTNQKRILNRLPPLTWDGHLCRLARQHSEDMAGRGFFDHQTPEGLLPKHRARAAGLRGFRVIAENIAYNKGYENPGAYAVEGWMKSSGHRSNILHSSFQYSAIGSYVTSDGSVYLTQVFISR